MARRRRRPRRSKRRSEARFLGWLFFFLVFLLAGLFSFSLREGFFASEGKARGGYIEVYFTSLGSPDKRLKALVLSARRRVHLAHYDIDNPKVVNALIEQKRRGVDVRVVSESEQAGWGIRKLREAGVPVRLDGRHPLMHDKFGVVDDSVVWTGSWNLGNPRRTYDNVLVIHSPEVAQQFEREFLEMWEGHFGAGSPRNTQCCFRFPDGTEIGVFFAPEDGAGARVIAEIRKAKREIRFMAYSFTHPKIARALIEAKRRGVKVLGLLDSHQARSSHSVYKTLVRAGIPVYLVKKRTLHHKLMIIDSSVVITGSFNFTRSADKRNDENLVIIKSPSLAQAYLEEFARIWKASGVALLPKLALFTSHFFAALRSRVKLIIDSEKLPVGSCLASF